MAKTLSSNFFICMEGR